jgi:hypothetical protein
MVKLAVAAHLLTQFLPFGQFISDYQTSAGEE